MCVCEDGLAPLGICGGQKTTLGVSRLLSYLRRGFCCCLPLHIPRIYDPGAPGDSLISTFYLTIDALGL